MIQELYFAAGCFWGAEKYFHLLDGVVSTEVGYANGRTAAPTYEQVYTDTTGFAETVHVRFDAEVLPVGELVRLFLRAIDPLSLNRQGEDCGTRYRTGVYYTEESCLPAIREALDACAAALGQPLAVECLPLQNFYRAEEYHQDYLGKNPAGYCHLSPALFEWARAYKPAKP